MKRNTINKYNSLVESNYVSLCDMLYHVVEACKGIVNSQYSGMQDIARKVFTQAVSLQHLVDGSNFHSTAFPDGANIVDFSSIAVIARSTLETYLHLWEIYVEPHDADELEYRKAAYALRGFHVRERFLARIIRNPNIDPKHVKTKIENNEDLRKRIEATTHYSTLDPNQQTNSREQGIIYPKRNIIDKGIAAGFSEAFMDLNYALQSDYTHGGSLSVAHLHEMNSQDEKLKIINIQRTCVCSVMARLIKDYASLIPQASDWYNNLHSNTTTIVDRYIEVGSNLK